MSSIYPDELVFGITWDFTDVQFSSLKAFNDAVRKYQENNNCWYPELIILNVPQVKIIISDYDALIEGDSDVLVDTVLMADNGQSFTAGELLLKTHNAFAVEKIASLAKGHFSGSMHVEELDGESTLLSYNCCCFLSCTAYDNIKTASVANSNNSSDHDVHELKSSLNCPNCHSDEWRLASMIYQDGLTHVNTSSNTVGVGVSSGIGVGVGYSETTGLHQTELSRLAAPPERHYSSDASNALALITFIVTCPLIYFVYSTGFFKAVVGAGLFTFLAVFVGQLMGIDNQENKSLGEKHIKQKENWGKTKVCMRCGAFY